MKDDYEEWEKLNKPYRKKKKKKKKRERKEFVVQCKWIKDKSPFESFCKENYEWHNYSSYKTRKSAEQAVEGLSKGYYGVVISEFRIKEN